MAKKDEKIDAAKAGQLSLFEAVIRQEMIAQSAPLRCSLNIRQQLITALSYSLRHAGKSREQIADEMSELTGEEISVHMINAWVCQSKEHHRFPLEYLPAFIKVTANLEPLNITSLACGAFTLRGPDALRADIRKIEEQKQAKKSEEKALDAEVKRLETLLKEVEARP